MNDKLRLEPQGGMTMTNDKTTECAVCHEPAVGKLWVDERLNDPTPRWLSINQYCQAHGEQHLAQQRRLDAIARMPIGRWSFGA